MRTNRFRCGVAALTLAFAAGCGGAASSLESTADISGPPPTPPGTELMQPTKKSKRAAARAKMPPRGFGGPPPIPGQ